MPILRRRYHVSLTVMPHPNHVAYCLPASKFIKSNTTNSTQRLKKSSFSSPKLTTVENYLFLLERVLIALPSMFLDIWKQLYLWCYFYSTFDMCVHCKHFRFINITQTFIDVTQNHRSCEQPRSYSTLLRIIDVDWINVDHQYMLINVNQC